MSFIPVIKAEFSVSLLQSSVSHDPSALLHNFVETDMFHLAFFQKNSIYLK